ncbi:MAG: hypothetical protein J6C26_07110 [Clostridia bacterium]|nr:hypothetical protein [Clostridia bacterium]
MKKSRILILAAIFLFCCAAFVVRLVKLQLIDGELYRTQSFARVVTKSSEKAARGEILDRYCRPLVRNETVLTVDLDLNICKDVNGTLAEMIRVFDSYDRDYTDLLPISDTEPYIYTEEKLSSVFRDFMAKRGVEENATAEQTIERLVRYYKLEEFSPAMARAIIGVRYSMFCAGAPAIYPFASDVPKDVITALKERGESMLGVEVSSGYTRVYTEENFASHILGYIGPISASEYELRREDGYALTDTIGKDGIERICENYLRGKNGYRYLEVNSVGAITSFLDGQDAIFGSDVILTIDKNMQQITEDSLASAVAGNKELNGEKAATSAAAVFLDVKTAEILSLVSFPDYNLSTFYQDYSTLSQAKDSPYMNRAIAGAFPPGSTWKIVTAVAGLEEGIITRRTTYHCTGRYTHYTDYQPTCNDALAHGVVNVESALQKSCNCFFYDVGRQLGSEKLAEYARRFGFGEKTGIELGGELSGIVASKSYRESLGKTWQSGENLLAAIGQTDNATTPIQLASMAATVANNGVRMKPYLIRSITNRDTGETVETVPTVTGNLNVSQTTLDLVQSGMYKVINEPGGTAYGPFREFGIVEVAGKSGTAETPPGLAAALFVGYAPVDNPQVAFAVVIEHGGAGAYQYTTQVIKDVLSYYFSSRDAFDSVSDSNELLP